MSAKKLKNVRVDKPKLPSEIPVDDLPYFATASQTVVSKAAEVVDKKGVRGITYKFDELTHEQQLAVTKVWKLEEITPEEEKLLPYEEWARYIFDPRRRFGKPEALDGVRVLELCRPDWFSLGISVGGSLLAEYGAEVIKVEDPEKGDPLRWVGPSVEDGGALKAEGENFPPHGSALYSFVEGRNRQCISVDITKEKGREIIKMLAKRSDVLMENYDPGYLDSLGIGYRQLRKINPRLIYVAVTGYGSFGADSWRKPFDSGIQAMGTVPSFAGPFDKTQPTAESAQDALYKPSRSGWPMGFMSGGATAAVGVVTALYYREKSGKGQMIDVSSYGHHLRWCDCSFTWYSMTGNIRRQFGNWDFEINPYGLHPAKSDEFGERMSVIAAIGPVWPRLCDCIGTDEMKKWETEFPMNTDRIQWKQQVEINAVIDEWTSQRTLSEIDAEGMKWGFAGAGCQNIKEICEATHFLDRASVEEVDDALYGKMLVQGVRPNFHGTTGRIKWLNRPMGWDNAEILRKYCGMFKTDLDEMEAAGVVGKKGGGK
jgi:crotonobetainyl-CoA:carnitine CoA-transferase CaiB-like acyl-CoA transferase